MDEDEIVKRKLNVFLQEFKNLCDSSLPDEVVIRYVVGVVGTLIDGEECFDLEEFIEVMSAYIPGFELIQSQTIFSWLKTLRDDINKSESITFSHMEKKESPIENDTHFSCVKRMPEESRKTDLINQTIFECRSEPVKCSSENNGADIKIHKIRNVFPDRPTIEIMKCLSIAKGDVNEAIQLLLESDDEAGVDSLDHIPCVDSISSQVVETNNEKESNVKDFVLSRYSFVVDTETDSKVYAPNFTKNVPKKLIRYRDNQIVSTKGERFWKAKEPDSEDIKRTYVNLKPARKYRFH